jgi:hypothetical protein
MPLSDPLQLNQRFFAGWASINGPDGAPGCGTVTVTDWLFGG